EGFVPRIASTASEARTAAAEWRPEAVVLDLVLPDGDGRDVCRELRATSDVPIVMLSARADLVDRVVGLELGADDYVVKPFSSRELVARLRTVLRRAGSTQPAEPLEIGGVAIDPATHTVTVRGTLEALPARQFDVLLLLMREAGRVVRRETLLEELWGGEWFGSGRTLDVHVARLRERIEEDSARPRYITTVRGVGFRFATDEDLANPGVDQPAGGSSAAT
ncbi:MAG TPA: response regulator transcription factor, partial [Actinomycetota bacterium]|nr:response regulator transcription factor [Actinomycetota bacterium]